MLRPLVQELLEVGSLFDTFFRGLTKRLVFVAATSFVIKTRKDLLFDSNDLNQTVLPQILLPRRRSHATRLLITDLDHLRHNTVESLDMLI